MADQYTPTPVKTKDDGDVVAGIVGATEANRAEVDALGNLQVVTKQQSGEIDEVGLSEIAGTATSTGSGTADAGTLRVAPATDVIQRVSKNGTANAVANPVWAQLSDGTDPIGTPSNPLNVTSDGVAGSTKDSGLLTSASVASGATVTLDTAAIGGTTGKLIDAVFSSTIRMKVELGTWDGTTFTAKRVFMVEAHQTFQFTPADSDEITFTAGANNKWRARIKNLDNGQAADVYASISWNEV